MSRRTHAERMAAARGALREPPKRRSRAERMEAAQGIHLTGGVEHGLRVVDLRERDQGRLFRPDDEDGDE